MFEACADGLWVAAQTMVTGESLPLQTDLTHSRVLPPLNSGLLQEETPGSFHPKGKVNAGT